MITRFSFFWVATIPIFFFLSTATADSGDRVFSLEAVGDSAPATGLIGSFRYGLSDVVSCEAGVGGRLLLDSEAVRVGGIGSLGVVAALDIFSWVPELTVGLGSTLAGGDFDPLAYLGMKFRWVLDFNWSLIAGVEASISLTNPIFSSSGRIGVSYQLD